MIFTKVPVDANPPSWNIALVESENHIWQVRLDRVLYGCRVHVGRKGAMSFVTDYCAGAEPLWHGALFATIVSIMSKFPESVTDNELDKIFPDWKIRPMFNDRECWHKLCVLGDMGQEFEDIAMSLSVARS